MSNGQFNAANNKLSRGIAGGIHKRRRVGSFEIGVQPDNNFYLMINRTEMVGKDLPSQDHAISLLHGIFTSNDGSTAGMNAVIADMLADGRGVLANTTPAAPNYTTNPAPSTTGPFTVGTTLSLFTDHPCSHSNQYALKIVATYNVDVLVEYDNVITSTARRNTNRTTSQY